MFLFDLTGSTQDAKIHRTRLGERRRGEDVGLKEGRGVETGLSQEGMNPPTIISQHIQNWITLLYDIILVTNILIDYCLLNLLE